jgi:hypothetical protein
MNITLNIPQTSPVGVFSYLDKFGEKVWLPSNFFPSGEKKFPDIYSSIHIRPPISEKYSAK